MVVICVVLCIGIRGIFLVVFDCKIFFVVSWSFKFRLFSKGMLMKVLLRRGGIIRCIILEMDKSKVVEGEDGWIVVNDGFVWSLFFFFGVGVLVVVFFNCFFLGIVFVVDLSRCRIIMFELFLKFFLFWVFFVK